MTSAIFRKSPDVLDLSQKIIRKTRKVHQEFVDGGIYAYQVTSSNEKVNRN